VQEAVTVAPMNLENDRATAALAAKATQPGQRSADTAGQLINQKSADQFQNELCQGIIEHRLRTMALFRQYEKAGKASYRPIWSSI